MIQHQLVSSRPFPGKRTSSRHAFTLLELLVSFVVLAILVILIASMIDATSRATRRPTEQAQTFQEARTAFELLTRRLSQATLNTYWDYDNPNAPTRYQRQSELHFVIGNTSTLLDTPPLETPTYAVFFQAPLGKSSSPSLRTLSGLLNNCGFFIRFASNSGGTPGFFQSAFSPAEKYRYRLYEWVQPSESLGIYNSNNGTAWFTEPIEDNPTSAQPIAKNIVALIFHPRLSEREDPTGELLTNDFSYNSRAGTATTLTFNQLPPQVDVIMVAMDEPSATRLAEQNGSNPPDLGLTGLFLKNNKSDIEDDIKELEAELNELNVNYRIFRTTIKIPGAKWSGY